MKKVNSRALFIFALFLSVIIFGSGIAFAAQKSGNDNASAAKSSNSKKSDSSQQNSDKVCEKINDLYEKLIERGENLKTKIKTKREQRQNTYENRVEERTNAVIANRGKIDDNFEANISLMLSKAKTQKETAAIETFRKAVEAAREKRRGLVDDAQDAFRETVRNQIQVREQNLSGMISSFKDSIDAAFDKAQTACENGEDIQTIRKSFQASRQTARSQFQNQEQNREKVGIVVSDAAKVKNAAIQKANQEFQNSLQKAIDDLKKVLSTSTTE